MRLAEERLLGGVEVLHVVDDPAVVLNVVDCSRSVGGR